MVLTLHGGGTPQSTSLSLLSLPTYVRKKALNPGRKTECTRAQMMGKSPDVNMECEFTT